MMHIEHCEDYQSLRKAAYPPLERLADALYWQNAGDNSKMEKYLADIAEIKNRFPKTNTAA